MVASKRKKENVMVKRNWMILIMTKAVRVLVIELEGELSPFFFAILIFNNIFCIIFLNLRLIYKGIFFMDFMRKLRMMENLKYNIFLPTF